MDLKSPKRQNNGSLEQSPANNSVQESAAIDALLKMDCQAFANDIRLAKYDILDALSKQISELQQALEAEHVSRSAKFSDVPETVIVSNVFPYLENRTDCNNLSLVTKEINNVATNHKNLALPWPENCRLWRESFDYLSGPTFSPDGKCVAFYEGERRIHIWCRKKGLVKSWEGHDWQDYRISSLTYSLDGKLLLSFDNGGEVKYWDTTNDYRCIQELTVELDVVGFVNMVAFSPNGMLIATGGGNQVPSVCLWRVSDGSTVREIDIEMTIHAIKISPDGKTVAVGGRQEDDELETLGLWTEDSYIRLDGHDGIVTDLAFSPDGKILASASEDQTIKLWDFPNRRCVRTLTGGHTDNRVTSISFSSCGNFLASGGSSRALGHQSRSTLCTWNVATGTCLRTMYAIGRVAYVEFSFDGRALLTQEQGQIRVRSTGESGLGER
jgi:WD40 repeat protein